MTPFLVVEGTLRLAGDEGPYTGVLEVFHEGVWGSVCDDAWGAFGSSVACKQLGTPGYISYSLRGTVVTRMFWLDNVVCTGEEEFLANCTHNGWGTHNCGGQEGVVLECDTYGMLFVCLSICLSVCLFVCLSVCLFVYSFVCLFIYLFVCLFIYLFVCLFIYLFICLFVCLFICLFVCQTVYLFVC